MGRANSIRSRCGSERCVERASRSVGSRRGAGSGDQSGDARRSVRQAEADGGSRSDLLSSRERAELAELRRENRDLRRSNEILKAASVFFARELDQPRPK